MKSSWGARARDRYKSLYRYFHRRHVVAFLMERKRGVTGDEKNGSMDPKELSL